MKGPKTWNLTHMLAYTRALSTCSKISLCHNLELEHQDVTRTTALTVLMQHEIMFSRGKKTKHTPLHSSVSKSDAGLRNKRTPRGKQETEIFIHSMSDAEWILARTYFPRISQLLSEFKKETPIILQENFAFLLFLINKDSPHLRSTKELVLLLIVFGFCCWMFGEGKIKKKEF